MKRTSRVTVQCRDCPAWGVEVHPWRHRGAERTVGGEQNFGAEVAAGTSLTAVWAVGQGFH